MSDKAPRLDGVRFAVLALGDTAYVNFCGVGKAIDARLEELGASRAADRVDLDLDYAKQAAEWTEGALAKLAPPETAPAGGTVVHVDFGGAGGRSSVNCGSSSSTKCTAGIDMHDGASVALSQAAPAWRARLQSIRPPALHNRDQMRHDGTKSARLLSSRASMAFRAPGIKRR